MAEEELHCPECEAVLETEDIYWAHLKIHHPEIYIRKEAERRAERKRRAKERMAKISPILEDIARTFEVSKYLANILYNTMRGRGEDWDRFKTVGVRGVVHIMEELIVPPHTAYHFYDITTKSIGDYQAVDWGSIGEKDWKTRYDSDEYKSQVLERLMRYGVTDIPAGDTEAIAIKLEAEEFAKEQIREVLREHYELGLDDERIQAITESEDILLGLAKEGDVRAKLALGDFSKVPLQRFLRQHELEAQPTRATKKDIEWVKAIAKTTSTVLLRDALIRGKFMSRIIYEPLRKIIAEEIENRRPEEMAEAMMEEPYALTPHLYEIIKQDKALTDQQRADRRRDLGLHRFTFNQLIDSLISRRDQMEDILADFGKLGANTDDINAIRTYIESRWADEDEGVRPPAEAHPGVVRETVRAFREQMEKMEKSILERLDGRLKEIEEKVTAAPKKLPPMVTLEPKDVPPPIVQVFPEKEIYIDTALHGFLCSMCIRDYAAEIAETDYGKPLAQLRGVDRMEAFRRAETMAWGDETAIVMRNPELETALQLIVGPDMMHSFPKNPALYDLCDRHFKECGYSWDNTIRQKVYEYVQVQHMLSAPDFERVGIPGEWVLKMIEEAEGERFAREIPR